MLTARESAKRKPIAPWTGADISVRSDHEVIVGGSVQSFHHDELVGRVRLPIVGRRFLTVVQHLVQYYRAVAVFLWRRVPLQANARRTHANRREVLW